MTTIRYKNGKVFVINYVRISLPVSFEKRGLRFKPAWRVR